ncbi:MAG TPA: DUF222 domain-containing protein [Nocardioides sp.]|nr:DUF222 domain-containing protein [Nocardioides sp.]
MIVARETAWLSREHRTAVDRDLAPRLESLGDKRVEAEAKKAAYRIDPAGFVDRLHNSERDRRVTLRPAPDAMTRLTALLPVAQGVAAYTALARHADTNIATGDERGRGHVMADTLVERLTGQAHASDVWKSPETVEACTMRSSHAREAQEVRCGVPRGRGAAGARDRQADRADRS